MKKVMLISHGLGSGGIEAFTINLAKNLPKDKYGVSIWRELRRKRNKEGLN